MKLHILFILSLGSVTECDAAGTSEKILDKSVLESARSQDTKQGDTNFLILLEMYKLSREMGILKERFNEFQSQTQGLGTKLQAQVEKLDNQAKDIEFLKSDIQECASSCRKKDCPRGYAIYIEGGFCYKIHSVCSAFWTARKTCQKEGADLVVFPNASAFNFFRDLVSKSTRASCNKYNGYWVGLTDEKTEGNWKWIDGTLARNGTPWNKGQPSNGGSTGNEDCATMWGAFNYKLNDEHCSVASMSFICAIQ